MKKLRYLTSHKFTTSEKETRKFKLRNHRLVSHRIMVVVNLPRIGTVNRRKKTIIVAMTIARAITR